jgi:hypothetical protein
MKNLRGFPLYFLLENDETNNNKLKKGKSLGPLQALWGDPASQDLPGLPHQARTGDWEKRGLDGRSDERMAPGPCGCGVQRSPAPGSMLSRRTQPSARGCDAPPRLERRASEVETAGVGSVGGGRSGRWWQSIGQASIDQVSVSIGIYFVYFYCCIFPIPRRYRIGGVSPYRRIGYVS